jgi:hypothetical protein
MVSSIAKNCWIVLCFGASSVSHGDNLTKSISGWLYFNLFLQPNTTRMPIQLGCQFRYSNRSNDVTKQTRSYPVQVTFGNQTHRCMFGRGWNQPGQGPITPVASGSDCCREEWLRCCGPTSAGAQRRWTFSALIQAHARGDLQDRFSSFFFHFLSQLLRFQSGDTVPWICLQRVWMLLWLPSLCQVCHLQPQWGTAGAVLQLLSQCLQVLLHPPTLHLSIQEDRECQLQDFCSQM